MTLLLIEDAAAEQRHAWREALGAALPGDVLIDGLAPVDESPPIDPRTVEIALVGRWRAGALAAWPQVRFVQSLWAGVERLLTDGALPPGVRIARMVDPAMTVSMAETAHWAVLSCQRGFFRYAAQQRAGRWHELPLRRADETCVVVLGLGELGGAVAQRLASAGYEVLGWSRQPRALPGVRSAAGDAALRPLLERADVVVNLLPLTPATRGLFDRERLAWLRPQASLVNLARGAHVVEADLLAALDAGALRHAVLDVFDTEPLPAAHPFWQHPRVTVLPHVAAPTDPRTAAAVAAANVAAWRQGRPLANEVDRARGY